MFSTIAFGNGTPLLSIPSIPRSLAQVLSMVTLVCFSMKR